MMTETERELLMVIAEGISEILLLQGQRASPVREAVRRLITELAIEDRS